MNYRRFGRTNWKVSEIGYGMWGMGGWTGSDDEESLAALQRASIWAAIFLTRPGPTAKDAARSCWVRSFALIKTRNFIRQRRFPPKESPVASRRGSALTIASLLNTSTSTSTAVWKTLVWTVSIWCSSMSGRMRGSKTIAGKKMDELRSAGLVNAVGISINRWEPWNAVRTVRSGLIDSVQVIYNIFDQNPEDDLFPGLRRDGHGGNCARAVR